MGVVPEVFDCSVVLLPRKISPPVFKVIGLAVEVPRVTEKLVVLPETPNPATSAPLLFHAVHPEAVPGGATPVQFKPVRVQLPEVVRLVPEAVVHHTVAPCSGSVICNTAMRKAMNHPRRSRFRRSVFIGLKGKWFRKGKACGKQIVTERGTRASKSGLESVGRRGYGGAWGRVVNKTGNPASVR